jgi:hypothetical protein
MTTGNYLDMAADGAIYGQNATYATARSTSTGYNTGDNDINVGQNKPSDYLVYRGFLKFDTSLLPATAVISQVNIRMVVRQDVSTTDFDLQIVKCDWSAYDPLSAANREAAFDACLAATVDQVWRNSSGIAVNTQYTSPNLDTSWPVKAGYTYYGLRSKEDTDASAPAGAEYLAMCSQDHATEAYRPLLIIEYTLGGVSSQAYFL